MKEFMLFIRNEIDHQSGWTTVQHENFLNACERYIGNLKKDGKLISAQPIVREGKLISGRAGAWNHKPFNESKEVIVGYYHVLANDMEDAMAIARANPEFEFSATARVEVRPVKVKEVTTGFVYPKS